ncbi:50S ribosomal protein L23 [candidate division KSB1 bacterium]|nr:50S ribosomal protein L23 [candidate division KSB1 bacterium]RQW05846.1 MAG: 50S ribosomal protein L23 [candidate division KSB1 bacterium]
MKSQREILVRPIITEKIQRMQEKERKYGFVVNIDANKIEIKNAVERKFDVSVTGVTTIKVKGKSKQSNTRRGITHGKRPAWKKAIVTLRDGDSIDFFETT